jgi:hypothetical protein
MIPVPPRALTYDIQSEGPRSIYLNLSEEQLQQAPTFDLSNWDESSRAYRVLEVYRYFDLEPDFVSIYRLREKTSVPNLRLITSASKLIGTPVHDHRGDFLGEVENMLLDLGGDRIIHVVLLSKGVPGTEAELNPIPPVAFRHNRRLNSLRMNASIEGLQRAPRFKQGEWPNFSEVGYSTSIYLAYGIDPYFRSEQPTVQDGRSGLLDQMNRWHHFIDQTSHREDVDISRRIHNQIISEKHLSVLARNVDVITCQGQVTLRGSVETLDEKQVVEEIVRRVIQTEKITNQMAVAELVCS